MFLCQVSGKISDFHEPIEESPTVKRGAWAVLTERRWFDGETVNIKHFIMIPKYQEEFVKRCIEKQWTVVIFGENPRRVSDEAWADGFGSTLDLRSVQLP